MTNANQPGAAPEEKKPLIGQATEAEIAQWKKDFKDVFSITVEDHIGYFKKPDRKAIAYASTLLKQSPIDYIESILENTWIGGSKELLTNDDYFLATMGVAEQLIETKTGELVKL